MAKKPRIEVDEELMRQMIAGQAPLTSKVVRRISDEDPEDTQDEPKDSFPWTTGLNPGIGE